MNTVNATEKRNGKERGASGGAFWRAFEERGLLSEALKGLSAWARADSAFRSAAERALGRRDFCLSDVREEGCRLFKRDILSDEVSLSLSLWAFVRPEGDGAKEASGVRCFALCAVAVTGEGMSLLSVSYGTEERAEGVPLDGDLVPVLSSSDYDAAAEKILRKYLPEGLSGGSTDCALLASRMGVGVCFHTIEADGSVLGLASMCEGPVSLYDPVKGRKAPYLLAGRCIVADERAHGGSRTRLAMTLAHEAVHIALHSQAYALRRLMGEEASFHRLAASPVSAAPSWQRWAEIHAGGIAPSLLMPEKVFEKKTDALFREMKKEGPVVPEGVERMVKGLAASFGVSVVAAKRRLTGLGYERARGVCNFVDGRYVRPYAFKEGSLGPKETFEVSKEDRLRLTDAKALSKAFFPFPTARFPYVFVDGHYAVDLPKYVKREGGEPSLTDYALGHMDECCARFDFTRDSVWEYPVGKPLSRMGTPSKEELDWERADSALFDELSLPDETLMEMSREERFKTAEYLSMLEGVETVGKALRKFMEMRNMSVKETASLTGIDDGAIYRYLRGDRKPVVGHLIAVCAALRLPPDVTEKCLALINFSLEGAVYSSTYYLSFVTRFMYCCPVWRINDFLTRHGENPITNFN